MGCRGCVWGAMPMRTTLGGRVVKNLQIPIARRNRKMRKTWRFDPLVCVVDEGVDADVNRGGRGSKGPVGEKGGKHPPWSVEEMIKLARAKWNKQAYFEGMPHNYDRIGNREWELQDLQKRLVEVGVKRTTDDIGKKWDNLFQQYKKVQRHQNASGGGNLFILTPVLRTEEGFRFRMDQRVYLEIDNMSQGNKTIYPDNLANTSVRGGVQMSGDTQRHPSVAGESCVGEDVGDGNDEDGGLARESGFSAGSTGGAGKRKNMRRQTFEAIAKVMEKHGALMADTVEGASKRQCSILERREYWRVEEAGRKEERRDEIPRADCEDDDSLNLRKKRTRQEEELEAKSKLWVDEKTFWGSGPGCMIADAVHDCANYYCAIVNGDAGATAPHGVIMPGPDVLHVRIVDLAPREPTLRRARRTENVAMRVIHGWIFRSSSRSDGFARAKSYVAVDYPTDMVKVVRQSMEWSRVVSASVVYHTLALKMDIPLWYPWAYIEDRPLDDDMAAHQESTVMHLASCFHDALRAGQWSDDGKMSQSRLRRVTNAFRLLLALCMWVMRMGGDDAHSYEEASYYAQFVAKPTIVAAGSRSFNWRRHVLKSANAVLTRLGKPPLTMVHALLSEGHVINGTFSGMTRKEGMHFLNFFHWLVDRLID
ncbi:hypothetical protein CBR_g18947 [Chara braunii]|uniref:Myb-like domain-containing protein n=1 Tax=Chara braunii TaxID=69332 RepID=A0A388KWX2_CHABU|nr:hypothetical protein CBR_g18947 [Chara braunii]|eukprot:GBG74537.1 hypothetical protein CBR_g18947 [Chara braunii]